MDTSKQTALMENVFYVIKSEAQELERLVKSLDKDVVCRVITDIENCKGKIITTGCGTSGNAGEKIAHTLSCVERPAFFLSPSEANHGGMGVIEKEDIVVLISNGGHTSELEPIVAVARKKGAETICVTGNPDSFLAGNSDIVLTVKVEREPDPFNMFATASTLSVISVFDAIALTVAVDMGYTKEQFRLIHPGGKVGERLAQEAQNK